MTPPAKEVTYVAVGAAELAAEKVKQAVDELLDTMRRVRTRAERAVDIAEKRGRRVTRARSRARTTATRAKRAGTRTTARTNGRRTTSARRRTTAGRRRIAAASR